MKEMLEYFSTQGESLGAMEKSRLHKSMREEYKKKGKVSVRHKDVKLILMTSNGRIILQRRSKWKGDNAGLWDKTIGGHITEGDSDDLTMIKECAEELGIPATVVINEKFKSTVAVADLTILGILTKLVYLDNYQSLRKGKDGIWVEPAMTQFYIGYYDGPIRFVDSESCGIQVFSIEELKDEIKQSPQLFAEDVKFIISKFAYSIKPAPKKAVRVLND